MTVQVSYVAMD